MSLSFWTAGAAREEIMYTAISAGLPIVRPGERSPSRRTELRMGNPRLRKVDQGGFYEGPVRAPR